ncbi:AraC family transcriptional regulator [Virgibacillus halophilus]|uniref:AraC family transcriptional regulator n=1 Tax=Tigheibacillus halophilus TaxID=361280 RepID=A0ABU5C3S7_9BACI|nr:AraC family transcriptional regulator [Virgibacillus halophilus]
MNWKRDVFTAIEKGHSEQAADLLKKYLPHAAADELEGLYIDVMNLLRSKNMELESGMFSLEQAARDWQAFTKLCAMKMNGYYQSKKYAAQIERYIREHFQEKISLDEAADAVGLSASYFSNLFKQEFGINFTDYINRLRMEAAKTMIEENKLSIKQISYMLGYKDPNYFSRVFKKIFCGVAKIISKKAS